MTSAATTPVEAFFATIAQSNMPALLDTLHPEIVLTSDGPGNVPWYGTFHGHGGARLFND